MALTGEPVDQDVAPAPAEAVEYAEAPDFDIPMEVCHFYHHMDLPGVGEVGSGWDLRDTVDDYLGRIDFQGKRVLDVGTASGFLTFAMEARGAEVVSFDMAEPQHWNVVPYRDPRFETERIAESTDFMNQAVRYSYWFAHKRMKSKARVFYGDLYSGLPEGLGSFDIAVLGMILPHLRDPFQALYSVSRLRPETIVVTQQCPPGDSPHAIFLPTPEADPKAVEAYFGWWVLSERCLTNMLGVLGYEVTSVTRAMHRCTRRSQSAPPPPRGRLPWRRKAQEPSASGDGMEECSAVVAVRRF
jgi:SAM-dependent methyltransferase